MIHIRVDNEERNDRRQFACGLGPELPVGDLYYFQDEPAARLADCPGCNPGGPRFGTPLADLSGRPGHRGYDRFREIASSWGYP